MGDASAGLKDEQEDQQSRRELDQAEEKVFEVERNGGGSPAETGRVLRKAVIPDGRHQPEDAQDAGVDARRRQEKQVR